MIKEFALHTWVFNSLADQIAVIDSTGVIVDVNCAWNQFGLENGLAVEYHSIGRNYLEIIEASVASGDRLAAKAAQGIRGVITDQQVCFYFEYPCHSPNEKRWFMMRVVRLKTDSCRLFAISHHNITQRKLAEERVEYLALHDPLTGLANRRYFGQFLSREIRRGIRNQLVISLLFIDIDYFKAYNDKFGHLAGDQCLFNVSQALLALSRRPGDLAARFGGDEFALILGETDFLHSQQVAEALLKAIDDFKMVVDTSKQVTISVGVASMICSEQMDENFLMQAADKALYHAKIMGRNRIVHTQPTH